MIKAQIVADSVTYPAGYPQRITSMLLTYPRIIHAELLTHRRFSRNAASSRAIPFKKMVESVRKDPFIPMAIQKDHKGMQGTEYFTGRQLAFRRWLWLTARTITCLMATVLHKFGYTKQLANRILEPFQMYTSLVTATDWENFFNLRSPQYAIYFDDDIIYHKSKKDVGGNGALTPVEWLELNKGMAEIHLMALAEAMWDAMNASTPKVLQPGEWHIPYEKEIESLFGIHQYKSPVAYDALTMVKVSSVMAARVSYTVANHELSEWTLEKYCKKADELAEADPLHASPFEHCNRAMTDSEFEEFAYTSINQKTGRPEISYGYCRNMKGFIQYRAVLEG